MGKEERLIHRDDVPMDVAESIVADLQAMYPGYTVQFAGDSGNPKAAEAAKSPEADKALVVGAKALTMTGLDFLTRPELITEAWGELRGYKANDYRHPYPTDKYPNYGP